jgi:hypothetical protein
MSVYDIVILVGILVGLSVAYIVAMDFPAIVFWLLRIRKKGYVSPWRRYAAIILLMMYFAVVGAVSWRHGIHWIVQVIWWGAGIGLIYIVYARGRNGQANHGRKRDIDSR